MTNIDDLKIHVDMDRLQSELLHIIAVATDDRTWLSYSTLVEADSRLIILYDRQIRRRLRQEIRQVAAHARSKVSQQ